MPFYQRGLTGKVACPVFSKEAECLQDFQLKSNRRGTCRPGEHSRVAPGLSATCSQADWRLGWKHGTTGGCRRSHGAPWQRHARGRSNPMRSVSVSALTALHFAPLHDWMKGCAWSGQRCLPVPTLPMRRSRSARSGARHCTTGSNVEVWPHTHTCLALDSHRPPMSFFIL